MTSPTPLRALILAGLLLTGCVTEPAPEDATVFGHVSKPKRIKEKPLPKPAPVVNELL